MVEIVYTRWNLANSFDDCIELNKALKTNKNLHDAILNHELGHKKKNTFKQDLFHDLAPINKINQKELVLFMLKHPRTFTQLLPFFWSSKRKQIVYDLNMIIIYGFVLGTTALMLSVI